MLAASFVGFIIAKISSGFKKTNLIQTILAFVFIIFSFSLRYIIEHFFENGRAEQTLENMSQATEKASGIYLPMGWFSDAVTKGSIISGLLLIVVSAALFLILFRIVGRSYRNINSALKTHAAGGKFKMTTQKKRSLVTAIAYKEFRRMLGSTTYITNAAVGEVLAVVLGIATLIFGFDVIVSKVTSGAPIDATIIQPAIPLISYFMVGMMSTTSCSPSLEGKNYWIVQSMPIEKKTLYQGKMLFNMCLTVPFMVFTVLCLCISARVPVINTLLYIILGTALCAFSTAWGCVCGIKHMKLDWENEVEVIKQGPGVAWYMLPNMFVVMILVVLIVFLGMRIDHKILALIFTAIAGVLALISYKRALALAAKR
jgi:ABC-2 type transport system permease protein